MFKRRFIVQIAAISGLPVIAGLLFVSAERGARAAAHQQVAVNPLSLAQALVRTGLGAEQLAAAGVSANSAATAVANAASYLSEHSSALKNADQACQSAQQTLDNLRRSIQSGIATPEQIQSQASAANALAQAIADRQVVLNAIIDAASVNLTTNQKNTLAKIRGNSGWELPIPYLTVDRTEAQWVSVRDALTAQRMVEANGGVLNGETQAFLNQINGDATVAAASANLSSNLAAVSSSWNQAINSTGTVN